MLVTFVSQCQKNALKRTRRILDAFANRIGDNVWQTAITEDGLSMVKKLLNASATRSTAVSCHRVRTRRQMELVWVIGRRSAFNEQGLVAVNRTKRPILCHHWKNDWQNLNAMMIVSVLAALLHDIGKSTKGFQHKLHHYHKFGDPYRHEWISLKIFVWLLQGCTTDQAVFERLCHIEQFLQEHQLGIDDLKHSIEASGFDKLPPIAQWIAWLIVSHHRLPALDGYCFTGEQRKNYLKPNHLHFSRTTYNYYQKYLKPLDYWVKNPEAIKDMPKEQQAWFFECEHLVLHSPQWQKQLKRYANKALNDNTLKQLSHHSTQNQKAIDDPFLLMLSRLCVMISDHNYSSLTSSPKRVQGSPQWQNKLAANTDNLGQIKQPLDEHLLGVAQFTAQFCRTLPIIHNQLPRLIEHQPLIKNTTSQGFLWQNKAFKLSLSQSKHSQTHGFFGINMASTGTGKTLANARIMYALTDPKIGTRMTIALGLRVLTLQTGVSLRKNLQLNDNQLATLVGGLAQRQLFESNAQNDLQNNHTQDRHQADATLANRGSESAETLIDEHLDGDENWQTMLEGLNIDTLIQDPKAYKMMGTPIVACTIDHLMQASECRRGGKYIAPMLRLLSSDLIFDEPDDFDHKDLPALSRLVHLAGLFGSRVLLSSATLPPDMVEGLFAAYLAGRKLYNQQLGYGTPQPSCAWFDEHNAISQNCTNAQDFGQAYQDFVNKRCQFLQKQPIAKMGQILPLALEYQHEKRTQFYADLANKLLGYAHQFHQAHHISHHHKKISIGLIRMANIQPLMAVAMAMHQVQALEGVADTRFYVCCYHSQQVLALRNRLEARLDKLLARSGVSDEDFAQHADIDHAINNHPAIANHIFIVLATPVAEVGRDHDYDWALVEPSSMRSIIQLAGRVWRHRNKVTNTPNIGIWQYNVHALKNKNTPAFINPGFESEQNRLITHDMNALICPKHLSKIDASGRIKKADKLEPTQNLLDLEHHTMTQLMNNKQNKTVVNAYFADEHTANRQHVHLSVLTPFRAGRANVDYMVAPDEGGVCIYEGDALRTYGLNHAPKAHAQVQPYRLATDGKLVDTWLVSTLDEELAKLAQQFPEYDRHTLIMRFCVASVAKHKYGYYFDERFGFWKKQAQ